MYQLTVAAVFKNEQHAIVEWIKHYLYHGFEHIYLFDDGSTDNTVEYMKPFMDKITLFTENVPIYLGRQRDIYNRYFLPIVNNKETQWLLICDLDEFIWSPLNIDLRILLMNNLQLSQIQINHSLFGSSNYIQQPESIVKYFIYKEKETTKLYKYFVNSNFQFTSLNVHYADYLDYSENFRSFIIGDQYFRYNHYRVQSLELWRDVKCTRGDLDHFFYKKLEDFYNIDKNDIIDTELWEQNKNIN